MTNKEKEIIRMFEKKLKEKYETDTREDIIRTVTYHLKDIYRNKGKNDAIRYIDYTIFLREKLEHSNELMEKLYFIKYYIDKVAC